MARKRLESDRLYKIKNREKLRIQAKEYYAKNKEWIASKRDNVKENVRIKEYYKQNPGTRRKSDLKCKYGITMNDFIDILKLQGNGCVICGSTKILCVDHDHSKEKGDDGFIRGILCNSCNRGIGMLKDNPLLIMIGAMYLLNGGELK